MNKWEFQAELLDRAERQNEQLGRALQRHGLTALALVFGVVGAVFFGLFFRTERTETETSGHLWWKDEVISTTEVPLGTRILFLSIGLVLILIAAACAYLQIRRASLQKSQRKYIAILAGVERIKVHQLADVTNHSAATVYRDIQRMMDTGLMDDIYIDFRAEEVVNKKYIPKTSYKTVVTCRACGANNELIVGITRPCAACGEPLVLNTP